MLLGIFLRTWPTDVICMGFTAKTLHFTAMATVEHVTRVGLSIWKTYASQCGIGVGVAHWLYRVV